MILKFVAEMSLAIILICLVAIVVVLTVGCITSALNDTNPRGRR